MSLSAKEAAARVGLTKPGLLKAIKQGKLSATKDQNGHWRIDPVELFRVYPPVSSSTHQPEGNSFHQHTPEYTENIVSLQREVALLRERLADKDDVIADLRHRLDVEAEERRRLTHLLTDQHEPEIHFQEPSSEQPPEPSNTQPKRKSFWQWLTRT
jgi:excisionase family DNA binding protein